jgi:predicted exporter
VLHRWLPSNPNPTGNEFGPASGVANDFRTAPVVGLTWKMVWTFLHNTHSDWPSQAMPVGPLAGAGRVASKAPVLLKWTSRLSSKSVPQKLLPSEVRLKMVLGAVNDENTLPVAGSTWVTVVVRLETKREPLTQAKPYGLLTGVLKSRVTSPSRPGPGLGAGVVCMRPAGGTWATV